MLLYPFFDENQNKSLPKVKVSSKMRDESGSRPRIFRIITRTIISAFVAGL